MVKVIEQLPHKEFKNEHGEKFVIHTNGVVVYMSGDEVNMMVDNKYKIGDKYIQLFNEQFGVWSPAELSGLGEVLQQLMKEIHENERD